MGAVVTSYTRWLQCVQVIGTENQEVYVTFSTQFERIWLESKKRLPDYVAEEPANVGLRSQYSIRLYAFGPKVTSQPERSASLWGDLRKVLGLESVKDAEGNVIQEPPLPVWANCPAIGSMKSSSTVTKPWGCAAAVKRAYYRETKRIWAANSQK